MKKRIIVWSFVAFFGISMISCKSGYVITDVTSLDTITAITLCKLRSDAAAKLDMHVLHVVTNPTEIANFLKGITIGKQIPITKAIYRRVIRVERRGTNEVISVSYFEPYYEKAGMKHASLRIGSKEYKTTRQSIEVMNDLYNRYSADKNRVGSVLENGVYSASDTPPSE